MGERPKQSPSAGRTKNRSGRMSKKQLAQRRKTRVHTSVEKAGLTDKEWAAVGWYFHADVNFNRAEACRRAGYKSPMEQSYRIFHRPQVVAEIERRRQEMTQEFKLSSNDVLAELQKMAFFNLGDYGEVNKDGDFVINLSDITREQMAALAGYEVETYTEKKDGEAREVKKVKIKPPDKLGALDRLARHFGLLNDTMQVNVNTDLAQQIIAAKSRLKAINEGS